MVVKGTKGTIRNRNMKGNQCNTYFTMDNKNKPPISEPTQNFKDLTVLPFTFPGL